MPIFAGKGIKGRNHSSSFVGIALAKDMRPKLNGPTMDPYMSKPRPQNSEKSVTLQKTSSENKQFETSRISSVGAKTIPEKLLEKLSVRRRIGINKTMTMKMMRRELPLRLPNDQDVYVSVKKRDICAYWNLITREISI